MVRNNTYGTTINRMKNQIVRLKERNAILQANLQKKQDKINKFVKLKNKYKLKLANVQRPYSEKHARYSDKIDRINFRNMRHGQYIRRNRDRFQRNVDKYKRSKHAIRDPYITKLVKDSHKKNGYFVRHRIYPLIHVREDNIDEIAQLVREKYQWTLRRLANKRFKHSLSIDDNTVKNIKLTFCDGYEDHISSKSVSSIDDVERILIHEINKHNGTAQAVDNEDDDDSEYDRYLMAVDFFIFNMSKKVGCSPNNAKPKFIFPFVEILSISD